MKEEEGKREDHQLLVVKILTEAAIKMIKISTIKVAEILNMIMDQKDTNKISRISKVDTRNHNSNQDHLSLLLLSLSIQKKLNLKKSKSTPISSKWKLEKMLLKCTNIQSILKMIQNFQVLWKSMHLKWKKSWIKMIKELSFS